MKIFTRQFEIFIKSNLICRFRGHRPDKWVEEYWAVAHATGNLIKICQICGKVTNRRKPKWEKSLKKSTTPSLKKKKSNP